MATRRKTCKYGRKKTKRRGCKSKPGRKKRTKSNRKSRRTKRKNGRQYRMKSSSRGRFMDIDEVPGVFDFLLSDESSYATGASFTIDGGWTAW